MSPLYFLSAACLLMAAVCAALLFWPPRRAPRRLTLEQALQAYTEPVTQRVTLPCTQQRWKPAEPVSVTGHPPWSRPHARGRLMTEVQASVSLPLPPHFTPSGLRPAQSWNCLLAAPKPRVRPHDHTGPLPAIGASRVPEWARPMLYGPLDRLNAVVAADIAHVDRMRGPVLA